MSCVPSLSAIQESITEGTEKTVSPPLEHGGAETEAEVVSPDFEAQGEETEVEVRSEGALSN
jgi:hypothetical protein